MKKDSYNLTILWSAIFVYISYFSFLSFIRFNSFSYFDFDLAVHSLTLWNIIHGSVYNSILGIPFLGNHMHLILFFIAPIYAIFSNPVTLLILQSLSLGLGAFPLYLIARERIGGGFAVIIALGYLLYPGLAFTNLFEFHPTCFAVLFLTCSLYAYDFKRLNLFIFFATLAMFSQENIPMAIIGLGILSWLEKREAKWIFIPLSIGCLYFIPALLFMKYFNHGAVQFPILYRHLGANPIEAILNPLAAIKFIFRSEAMFYIMQIFIPLLFIPLLVLIKLIPAVPFFLQHILSIRAQELSMQFHYTAEIIPFLFIALVYGIKKMLTVRFIVLHSSLFRVILIVFFLFSAVYYGPYVKDAFRIDNDFHKDPQDYFKEDLISMVPRTASVIATFEFLPKLSSRKKLYSLHHIYTGFHTLSNKPYFFNPDTEYALVDFNDRLTFKKEFYNPSSYLNLQKVFLYYNWEPVDMLDSVVLLKRSSTSAGIMCRKDPPVKKGFSKGAIEVDGSFALVTSEIRCTDKPGIVRVEFRWAATNETANDFQMLIKIVAKDGRLIRLFSHPICYRIFPTQSWKRGECYSETLQIYIPPEYIEDGIILATGFYNHIDGIPAMVSSNGAEGYFADIGSLECRK